MHPARNFILFLMTQNSAVAEDNDWIRETLNDLDLYGKIATDPVLNALRQQVREAGVPSNYQPSSRTHGPSIEFQRKLRVREMHIMTDNCKRACELRANPDAKEKAEQMLLAFTPFAKVAQQLNKHCRTRYRAEVVALFYHYFFDIEALPRSTWSDVLRRKSGATTYKAALIGKPNLVLWRMGEDIVVETKEALEEAFTQATMRLIEMRSMPTNLATVKMMQCCVESIVRVHGALGESEVRMKDVLTQLKNFQQSRKAVVIPSYQDLGETSYDDGDEKVKQLLPKGIGDLNA